MEKIKMTTPLVEMDGDEMTRTDLFSGRRRNGNDCTWKSCGLWKLCIFS